MHDLGELNEEMRRAGAWVFTAGLAPPGSTSVLRDYNGEVTVTDGPFVEAKEHVGGFTIIEAPDRDAALTWGKRLAGVVGLPIEVRPLADHGSPDEV